MGTEEMTRYIENITSKKNYQKSRSQEQVPKLSSKTSPHNEEKYEWI